MNLYFAFDEDVRNQFCREHNYTVVNKQGKLSRCTEERRVQVRISLMEEAHIDDAIKVEVDIDAMPQLSPVN